MKGSEGGRRSGGNSSMEQAEIRPEEIKEEKEEKKVAESFYVGN